MVVASARRRLRNQLRCLREASSPNASAVRATVHDSGRREQFAQQGWISLGCILSPDEVKYWQRVYDRDRLHDTAGRWVSGGIQSLNYDVLLSSPEFHELVRHPAILSALAELMGDGELAALGEISLRHMQPTASANLGAGVHQEWHRDHPHADRRLHRTGYYTLMLYLSDVDERTPCFSISPEGAGDDILPAPQQLAERGYQDLHGPAGTAVLFNLSVLHRASGHSQNVARSTHERKSLQLYYTHRVYQEGDRGTPESWAQEMRRWRVERSAEHTSTSTTKDYANDTGTEAPGVNVDPDPGPTEQTLVAAAHAEAAKRDEAMILADTSIIPPSLWRDHPDPEVRAFFCDLLSLQHRSAHSNCYETAPRSLREIGLGTGPRLNPRSIQFAAEARAQDIDRRRLRPDLILNKPRKETQPQ